MSGNSDKRRKAAAQYSELPWFAIYPNKCGKLCPRDAFVDLLMYESLYSAISLSPCKKNMFMIFAIGVRPQAAESYTARSRGL